MVVLWWFYGILWDVPSGYVKIAIETMAHSKLSEFFTMKNMVDLFIVM